MRGKPGCRCRACSEGKPHDPVDGGMILRALRGDPPVYRAVERRLRGYDGKPAEGVRRLKGGLAAHQPWVPRPARRRAA
jgi:hypothetical protein